MPVLELLAGPFTVQDDSGAHIAMYNPLFIDGRGLYSVPAHGACTFDGRFHLRGRDLFLAEPYHAGYDLQSSATLWIDTTTARRFEPETGCRYEVLHTVTNTAQLNDPVWTGDRWLVFGGQLGDSYLRAYASTDNCATFSVEYVFAAGIYNGVSSVHPTGDGRLCIGLGDKTAVFYNPVAKAQVGSRVFIDPTTPNLMGLWYSAKHDVFLSLHNAGASGHQTRVWANAPRPYALSTPTALTALLKGQVTTFRAQLTGSNGEPCPSEIVAWALTGAGTLLASQSTTDANGYAIVQYAAPVDSLPSVTIAATVKF